MRMQKKAFAIFLMINSLFYFIYFFKLLFISSNGRNQQNKGALSSDDGSRTEPASVAFRLASSSPAARESSDAAIGQWCPRPLRAVRLVSTTDYLHTSRQGTHLPPLKAVCDIPSRLLPST